MAQYIDKSALVAEIKRRKELVSDPILLGNDLMIGERNAYFNLLSFIDTLEVKEVDLEKNLTWEDIGTIDQLLWELSIEWSGKEDNEGYFKEVLKRFKAQKV